jgi:hypothetical protein
VVDGAVVELGDAVEVGELVGGGVGVALDAGATVADVSSFPPQATIITRHPISSAAFRIVEVWQSSPGRLRDLPCSNRFPAHARVAGHLQADLQPVSSRPVHDLYMSMQRAQRLLAGHRWFALREIALIVVTFVGYERVRHLTKGDTDAAFANARTVVDVERALHVFDEHRIQDISMRLDGLIQFLNHYYVFVHFPLSFGFVGWVVLRHRDLYPRFRNWFLSVTLTALVIHVAFPLAPPRMLDEHGFVDTLHAYGPRIYTEDTNQSVANQFAAMPSLHFGWALLVAMMFIRVKRTRWSWIALAHPAITLLAIVATANHYVADAAVAGALVLGINALITVVAKRRERVEQPTPIVVVTPAVVGAAQLPGGTLATRGESPVSLPLVTRRKQRGRHHHYHRRSHRQDRHRTYHRRRFSGVGDS